MLTSLASGTVGPAAAFAFADPTRNRVAIGSTANKGTVRVLSLNVWQIAFVTFSCPSLPLDLTALAPTGDLLWR